MLSPHTNEIDSVQMRNWNESSFIEVDHITQSTAEVIMLQQVTMASYASLSDIVTFNFALEKRFYTEHIVSFSCLLFNVFTLASPMISDFDWSPTSIN